MSRPRSSARGATAPAGRGAAARPGGRPGVFVQTPKSDIYVVMLAIAVGAMLIASLLMAMILAQYDFKVSTKGASLARPSATTLVAGIGKIGTVRL